MENISKMQNIILENRGRLNVTGVLDVLNFDEEVVTLMTEMGLLVVKGSDLHLNNFSLDNTELGIEGTINSMQYSDKTIRKNKEKFFEKIFK